MTAAAEEAIAEDHIINLAELTNYQSGTADCPAGITASYGKAIIQDDYTIVSYTLGNTRDEAFYLNGAEYDASDYAGENLCIKVWGKPAGEHKFIAGTDSVSISYNNDHSFDGDSDGIRTEIQSGETRGRQLFSGNKSARVIITGTTGTFIYPFHK